MFFDNAYFIIGTSYAGKSTMVKDLAKKLKIQADELATPIQDFVTNVLGNIGAAGSEGWGGESAEAAKPTLEKILIDIKKLQELCERFSVDANVSMAGFERVSAESTKTIQDVKTTYNG